MAEVQDEKSEDVSGCCEHYTRKCMLMAPCCEKLYSCRLCHDEEQTTHKLDRKSVDELKCRQCNSLQQIGRNCSNCGILFAKYSCLVCRLYDDIDKQQFHCDGCGICRIGGREAFVHCEKCEMCISKTIESTHKCLEKISKKDCPVCMEDLHTSRKTVTIPKCGHLIHSECQLEMMKHGLYACSVCNASLINMSDHWLAMDEQIAATLMPPIYQSYRVNVLCRDCHEEGLVPFHVLGLKCSSCGAYNTTRIGGDDPLPEDDASAEQLEQLVDQVTAMGAQSIDADGSSEYSNVGEDSADLGESWETIESEIGGYSSNEESMADRHDDSLHNGGSGTENGDGGSGAGNGGSGILDTASTGINDSGYTIISDDESGLPNDVVDA